MMMRVRSVIFFLKSLTTANSKNKYTITRVFVRSSNENYSLQRYIEEYKDYYSKKKQRA
jgi:hypothetical protein